MRATPGTGHRSTCHFIDWRIACDDAPVAPLVPVLPEHFGGVLGTAGAIAALQGIRRAVFIASPAGSFRMARIQGKLLRHFGGFEKAKLGAHITDLNVLPAMVKAED
jgi:hypothetical protein